MKSSLEIIIVLILLAILGLFLNPTHLLMPDSLNMMMIVALILGFLAIVGLFWRENSRDERDALHTAKAGRWSFFAGASILVVGICVQAQKHAIDPWLIYALAGMVLTKIIARFIHTHRN